QIVPTISHFAVRRLQGALGIRIAGPVPILVEKRPYVQTLVPGCQKQANQASAQDSHAHQQLLLELPESRLTALAKGQQIVKSCLGFGANRHAGDWTSNPSFFTLNRHGADSEPLFGNGKDMLHTLFQLPPGSIKAAKPTPYRQRSCENTCRN